MPEAIKLKPLLRFIFCIGIMIILIGFLGQSIQSGIPGFAFLNGGLSLGGGLIICWIFSIKHQWLGLMGAGVVSLLGFCKSITNFRDFLLWLSAPFPKPAAISLLQMSVALMTFVTLIFCIRALIHERTRRMIGELK
jgi:hypothetical protein